jgi:isoleucyl-tRNA synthetase
MLRFWRETDAFNELRRLRAKSEKDYGRFSFLDGPITANNPMGVHHAWGRTYKDLYQRYQAMLGKNQRWQNGFDCQGLWVEVNVEKELGFQSKRDIEAYGLAEFVKLCKMRVLQYAAVQTEQSIRLGYWMDWNDPDNCSACANNCAEDGQQKSPLKGRKAPSPAQSSRLWPSSACPNWAAPTSPLADVNNYQIWRFLQQCDENGWLYKGTRRDALVRPLRHRHQPARNRHRRLPGRDP